MKSLFLGRHFFELAEITLNKELGIYIKEIQPIHQVDSRAPMDPCHRKS
jgi:hypothetical protein